MPITAAGRPLIGKKVRAKDVPRKAKARANGKPAKRKGGQDAIGKSMVRKWKDGSGEVRVGKMVVQMMEGEIDPKDWTLEELMQGHPEKDANGRKWARKPHVIPRVVYDELVRRVTTEAKHRFAAELQVAIEEHFKMLKDEDAPYAVRLKAIEMIYERVLGAPDQVLTVHDGDLPWKVMMAEAIVGTEKQIVDVKGTKQRGRVAQSSQRS